jgi:hypothetical protein
MRIAWRPLAIAAVIAPALTMLAATVVFGLIELRRVGAADIGLAMWTGDLLRSLVLGTAGAVLLGFIGAFVLLLPAFTLVSIRESVRGYCLAGAAAGALHGVLGLLSRQVNLPDPAKVIGLVLGLIAYIGEPLFTALLALASPLAGLAAGYAYARLAGARA